MACPKKRVSKWRCDPVERPVFPPNPIGSPASTYLSLIHILTKGGANIINLRGRSSFQSPSYVSIEMIAAAMGGKPLDVYKRQLIPRTWFRS